MLPGARIRMESRGYRVCVIQEDLKKCTISGNLILTNVMLQPKEGIGELFVR
jgi:hypothetical protein